MGGWVEVVVFGVGAEKRVGLGLLGCGGGVKNVGLRSWGVWVWGKKRWVEVVGEQIFLVEGRVGVVGGQISVVGGWVGVVGEQVFVVEGRVEVVGGQR